MTPTIQTHLDDCKNCEHQRIHHDGYYGGKCLIGTMTGNQCPCSGFVKK